MERIKPRKRKEENCPITPNETREWRKDVLAVLRGMAVNILKTNRSVDKLITQGGKIMATLAEVKAAVEQVKADIIAEKGEVQTALKALKDEIQALKDQIAAGNPVTSADMDSLLSSVNEIGTGVKDISEPSVPV